MRSQIFRYIAQKNVASYMVFAQHLEFAFYQLYRVY